MASFFSLRWLLQPGADSIPDKLAFIPMTAAFMGFSLGGEVESAWQRWLIRGAQLLLILGLLKSESKGAVIGLLAGLLVFGFLSTLGARATLLALASLIAIALAAQGPAGWQEAMAEGHLHYRKELAISVWEAAQERLLLGNGPATFALGYQKYRPAGLLPESIAIESAHDDYLELAVEMGLVGLAAWLWLLGAAFHRGYRFAWFSDLEDEPAGVTAGLAAAAVFSLLDSALAEPTLVWWLCALLGLIVSLPVSPDYRRPWPLAAHLVVGACLVIGGLWTLQVAWSSSRADLEIRKAESAREAGKLQPAVDSLSRAQKLVPGYWWIPYQRAAVLIRLAGAKKEGKLLREASKALLLARTLSPRRLEVLEQLGLLYLRLGEFNAAEETFRAGSELAPYSTRFPRGLIEVSLQRRDYKSAAKQAMLLYLVDEGQLEPTIELMRLLARQNSDYPAEALDLVELPQERLEQLFVRTQARLLESGLFRAADILRSKWRAIRPDEHAKELELIRRMELSGQSDEAYWRLTELAHKPNSNVRDRAELLCEWSGRAADRGQRTVAIKKLEELLRSDPTLYTVRLLLVELRREADQTAELKRLVDDGLRLDPIDPDLLYLRAELLANAGRFSEAKGWAQKALKQREGHQEALKLIQLIETVEGP